MHITDKKEPNRVFGSFLFLKTTSGVGPAASVSGLLTFIPGRGRLKQSNSVITNHIQEKNKGFFELF